MPCLQETAVRPFPQQLVVPTSLCSSSQSDDSSSVSSTFSVDREVPNNKKYDDGSSGPLVPPDNDPLRSAAPKKTVRFHLSANILYENDATDKEDTEDLWYTTFDFVNFKDHCAGFGRYVRRQESALSSPTSYSRVFEETYNACCFAAHNSNDDDDDDDEEEDSDDEERERCGCDDDPLSEAQRQRFRQWIRVTATRVGAERTCVRYLRDQRRKLRKEIVATVLDIQREAAALEINDDPGLDDYIRDQSRRISRPSRLFAQLLAAVQAEC